MTSFKSDTRLVGSQQFGILLERTEMGVTDWSAGQMQVGFLGRCKTLPLFHCMAVIVFQCDIVVSKSCRAANQHTGVHRPASSIPLCHLTAHVLRSQ